jgi:hypothetical protein
MSHFAEGNKIPKLRAVFINVPPLLADLVRRVAATRGLTLAETAETATADIIIRGPAATPLPPGPVPVLTISPDLTHITGPGPADCAPFTPDALARLLRAISPTI